MGGSSVIRSFIERMRLSEEGLFVCGVSATTDENEQHADLVLVRSTNSAVVGRHQNTSDQ